MTRRLIPLLAAAVLALAGCGSQSDTDAGHNDADVTFAQQMIPHHQQAVEMAEMALDPAREASEPVREQPILSSWQALLDYLRLDMAHLTTERVRVLYLNTKNMLIRDEVAGEGSIDQAPFYTREIIRRSIDLGAAAIILVHNHPSGDSSPSRQDITMTREIIEAGKRLGISVHDHVIIGKDGFTSLRSAGLL